MSQNEVFNFLDIHNSKRKTPDWFKKQLDPNAGNVVQFVGGSYPHNIMPFILEGIRSLLKLKSPNRKVISWGDGDNLMTTDWPNLKLFLGLGWLLFSLSLKQQHITPRRLLGGGSLPAPSRHAQP